MFPRSQMMMIGLRTGRATYAVTTLRHTEQGPAVLLVPREAVRIRGEDDLVIDQPALEASRVSTLV